MVLPCHCALISDKLVGFATEEEEIEVHNRKDYDAGRDCEKSPLRGMLDSFKNDGVTEAVMYNIFSFIDEYEVLPLLKENPTE